MTARALSLDARIRRVPELRTRRVGGEVVLVAPRTLEVHVLNGVAERVWNLADGRSLAEIRDALIEEYVADAAQIADDVRRFAEDLAGRGFVEVL